MTTLVQRFLGLSQQEMLRSDDPSIWSGVGLGGGVSATGLPISTSAALKISTVWACAGLISDCVGMLPAKVYERTASGKRDATEHPLYSLLHDQPNDQQTAFEFKSQMTLHALIVGAGRAKIISGQRGFADKIEPIHPDRILKVDQLASGAVRYKVRELDGQIKTYTDEDVLDVKGMTLDGVNPLSVVGYARESFGLALAAERSGAKTFANGSRLSGVLTTKKALSPDARARLKDSWQAMQGGVDNTGKVAVLEEDMTFQGISMSHKDSQWLESREHQAEDICRWFRVPPHMVGLTSKATTWGSGIEEMGLGFVTYTLMPWLVRWQQAISRDLIIATQKYFVEFVVDGLLRGRALDRYNVYRIGRELGMYSPNDLLRMENRNPRTDAGGDKYIDDMGRSLAAPAADETAPAGAMSVDIPGHHARIVRESAARVVRKEIAAMTKAGKRGNLNDAADEFYQGHAALVAQALAISPARAGRYVADQLARVAGGGLSDVAVFEAESVGALVALTLEEE